MVSLSTSWLITMAERSSYVDVLKEKLEHAPITQSTTSEELMRDAEMQGEEVEPELIAAVTNLGKNAKIHPTVASPGECLPEGFSRSCAGFLLCNTILEVKVDQEIVRNESDRLQKLAVVVYFVGGRQTHTALLQWVAALQKQTGDWIGLGRDLGRGFFQILTRQTLATQKLLMLTPHRSKWGTCILQTWMPGFDSSKPSKLKVPTWVTLRGIPGEFLGVAKDIAAGLGDLLGFDKRNDHTADQRFCVALQSGQGWKTQLAVQNEQTQEQILIMVDYCNLPIRCRCCYSTEHLMKDCPSIKSTGIPGESVDGAARDDGSSAAASGQAASGANTRMTEAPRDEGAAVMLATDGNKETVEDGLAGASSAPVSDSSGNPIPHRDGKDTSDWQQVASRKNSTRNRLSTKEKQVTPSTKKGQDQQGSKGRVASAPAKTVSKQHGVNPQGNQSRASAGTRSLSNQGPRQRKEPTNEDWVMNRFELVNASTGFPIGTGVEKYAASKPLESNSKESGRSESDEQSPQPSMALGETLTRAEPEVMIVDETEELILAAVAAADASRELARAPRSASPRPTPGGVWTNVEGNPFARHGAVQTMAPPRQGTALDGEDEVMIFSAASRPMPDLNNVAANSGSLAGRGGSWGEGAQAAAQRPMEVLVGQSSGRSGASTPYSPSSVHEGLAAELHAEFFAWMKHKNDRAIRGQNVRRGSITPQHSVRRQDAAEAGRRQRSSLIAQLRETQRDDDQLCMALSGAPTPPPP